MNRVIMLMAVLFVCSSCTNDVVFTQYKSVAKNKWHKDSIVQLNYMADDTLQKNKIFIHLRNNKNYEFNNLFLIASVKFPNETKITDTLEYEMTDGKGRFLGSGFTDVKENKLEYKTNITFPLKGNYAFSIKQAMRKLGEENGVTYLNGVTDVGIEIEKVNTDTK